MLPILRGMGIKTADAKVRLCTRRFAYFIANLSDRFYVLSASARRCAAATAARRSAWATARIAAAARRVITP